MPGDRRRSSIARIPTVEEEENIVDAAHGSDSWESKVLHVLHTPAVELTLCGLLVLDVMILFAELFLGAQFPLCSTITRDAISCCPDISEYCEGRDDNEVRFLAETGGDDLLTCEDHGRHLAGGGNDYQHSVCNAGIETACPSGCDDHKYEWLHYVHYTFFSFTIAILGIFFIELCLVFVCLKPKNFIRKPLYVMDIIVVALSLVLELTFYFKKSFAAAALAGILIITRLWRFVRVGHGIIMVTTKYNSQTNSDMKCYNKELEDMLVENGIELPKDAAKKQSSTESSSGPDKMKRKDSVQTANGSDC